MYCTEHSATDFLSGQVQSGRAQYSLNMYSTELGKQSAGMLHGYTVHRFSQDEHSTGVVHRYTQAQSGRVKYRYSTLVYCTQVQSGRAEYRVQYTDIYKFNLDEHSKCIVP
jgi:hypothetical protein